MEARRNRWVTGTPSATVGCISSKGTFPVRRGRADLQVRCTWCSAGSCSSTTRTIRRCAPRSTSPSARPTSRCRCRTNLRPARDNSVYDPTPTRTRAARGNGLGRRPAGAAAGQRDVPKVLVVPVRPGGVTHGEAVVVGLFRLDPAEGVAIHPPVHLQPVPGGGRDLIQPLCTSAAKSSPLGARMIGSGRRARRPRRAGRAGRCWGPAGCRRVRVARQARAACPETARRGRGDRRRRQPQRRGVTPAPPDLP